jgi:fructosamine-3-kinase
VNTELPLEAVACAIAEATGRAFHPGEARPLGGGCIHSALRLTGRDGRSFFVKHNHSAHGSSFDCEAHALRVIAATRTLRVPEPVISGEASGRAFLVLEFLQMGRCPRPDWAAMGRDLARMHRHGAAQFGWSGGDTFIGPTPQVNQPGNDWIAFYRDNRLLPQIRLARSAGLKLAHAEALLDCLPRFFGDYRPAVSLLHGDLWSGNAGFLNDGTPVVFDPASYFGDRETDIALTRLFGGYPAGFYAGYNAEWPLDAGERNRRDLYNLYHVLNHFNLFGGGYGSQAAQVMQALVRHAG